MELQNIHVLRVFTLEVIDGDPVHRLKRTEIFSSYTLALTYAKVYAFDKNLCGPRSPRDYESFDYDNANLTDEWYFDAAFGDSEQYIITICKLSEILITETYYS